MTKTLVEFSQRVTERVSGKVIQGELAAEGEGFKDSAINIDWAKLIELVGQIALMLLSNCPVAPQAGQLTGAIKKPNIRQRIMFRSHVASTCECCDPQMKLLSGRIADSMIDTAATLSDEELTAVVADAINPDFFVV